MPLRYLADMNVSPETIEALKRDGYEIVRVSDLLPASAPDRDILLLARENQMVVITQDLDFSTLLALGGQSRPSLITLRLVDTNPQVVAQRLRQVLPQIEDYLSEGGAVTVEDSRIRLRKLPIRGNDV